MEWSDETDDHIILDDQVKKVSDLFNKATHHERDLCEEVDLIDALQGENIIGKMDAFNKHFSTDPNFQLWMTYLEMVETMLNFIRANREGNWRLHLDAFAEMLPWLAIYDHTNYAK